MATVLRPPRNASADQLQTYFKNMGVSPQDAMKFLADKAEYHRQCELRGAQRRNAAGYIAYSNGCREAKPDVACVETGMSVVADNTNGVILPCCLRPMHIACLGSLGSGATCPAKDCGQVIDGHYSVAPRVLLRHTEVYAAYRILTAPDQENERNKLQEMTKDQDVNPELSLNSLIASDAPLATVIEKARGVAMAERALLQKTAVEILKQLNDKPPIEKPPVPQIGKAKPTTPVPSPKRVHVDGACNDTPVDPDTPLPPGENGRKPRVYSGAYEKMLPIMFTNFDARCKKCSGKLFAKRSVVSPVETDCTTKWMCSQCVFGVTSRELIEMLERGALDVPGQHGGHKAASPAPKRACYGKEVDVGDLFTL